MDMMAAELSNVTKVYNDKRVLERISVSIEKNKFTCLLGSSGSGKTTALKLLAGFESPDNGEISISGKVVSKDGAILIPPSKRNIGFIFQDLSLWPHFTVFENLAFGLKIKKDKNYKEKIQQISINLGIQHLLKKYPDQLSGGQQQLVALGRSLVLKPAMLLMDEPLTNLDVKLKKMLIEKILQIKEERATTIIYVTHDHREAFSLADQIVVFKEGKIEEKGTPLEIEKSNNEYVKYFIEL